MRVREDYRTLSGPEKAAIFMLALGEDYTSKLFEHMDDDEIMEISQTMASFGKRLQHRSDSYALGPA